ncbi:MAG: NHL repeat-containing protein [Thermomicrobiales bacterium]
MPTHDALTPDPTYDRLIQRLRQPVDRRALGGLAAGALAAGSALSLLDGADAKKKKKKKKKKSTKKKGQATTTAPTTASPTPTSTTTGRPGVPNFAFQQMLGVMAENTPGVLANPLAVATGPDDEVYVLDGARIISFSSDGVYLASYGSAGTGEGEFNYPEVLAVDTDGWMYVADSNSDEPQPPWRVQVLDDEGEFVARLQPNSGQLGRVDGIAIRDDGRVFVTSIPWTGGTPQVLAWDWSVVLSEFTFAGAWNVPQLQRNYGSGSGGNRATIDSDGWLYVMVGYQEETEFFQGIRVLDTEDHCAVITSHDTEYSDGAGKFLIISGLAVTPDGTLYVTDNNATRLQRFTWAGNTLVYDGEFGTEGPGLDNLSWPCGVAVNSTGEVLIADNGNSRILQLDGDLTNPRRFNPLPPAGVFITPIAAAQDADKNYYITDATTCLVHKLAPSGAPLTAWGGYGTGAGEFAYPAGIAVHDDKVYVSDYDNSRIQVFDTDGDHQSTITHGALVGPAGLAVRTGGTLVVADDVSNRIETFSGGSYAGGWPGPAGFDPWEVAVSSAGNVHALDYQNNAVQVFSPVGSLLRTHPAGDAPEGLALDAKDNIYIGSNDVREILVLTSTGNQLTTLDNNEITYSKSLLIDADGNLIQISYAGVRLFTPTAGRAGGSQQARKDGQKNRHDRKKGNSSRRDKKGTRGKARHKRNRAGASNRASRKGASRRTNAAPRGGKRSPARAAATPPREPSRKRDDLT